MTDMDRNRSILFDLTQVQDVTCQVQASITSTASLASFFWTFFIALNIYLTVVRQNSSLTNRLRLLPHVICWGVPICIFIITIANDRYGVNNCGDHVSWWCWIKTFPKDIDSGPELIILWQLVSGKFWEIATYLFVGVLYALVVRDIASYVCLSKNVF